MHGCMLAGNPFQTLRPGLPAEERSRLIAAGGLLIGRAELAELAEAGALRDPVLGEPPASDDVLCRVLSSGTSGAARPVDLTWENVRAAAAASSRLLPLEEGRSWLCCLPLDHIGGLSIPLRCALAGACAEIHDRFEPDDVVAALQRCDYVSLVPTQLLRLLDSAAPLDRPAGILLGGAPAAPALLDRALDAGARIYPSYGLTEACSQVCTATPEELAGRLGSSGRPLPGVEVEIAARDGERGEILVSGPTVAPGALAADGRLHTGDLGRIDRDGYLWVEGRADDLIVSGGENVLPAEVEAALREHPAVADVAVAGREDPEWGEVVVAWVVPAGPDPDPAALREHCRSLLAAPKVPKRIELVSELPRTGSGKLLRRSLR